MPSRSPADGQPDEAGAGAVDQPAQTRPHARAALGRIRTSAAAGWLSSGVRRLGRRWRGAPAWVRWPLAIGGWLFVVLALGGLWLWHTTDLPPAGGVGESAILLDRNGQELAVLSQGGTRVAVDLEDLDPHVPAAVVAAEDRRFYDHTGVDPIGIARAFWNNLNEDDLQGGSTITQQLVKNVYLDSDRTIERKLREAVLAVKLERSVDKEAILERYLNTVYFGRGAHGIEAAARAYFDTHATELRVEQTAMLVGMLRAPESFDPLQEPEDVRARRDQVLDAMAAMGNLDESAAERAKAQPVQVTPAPRTTTLTAGVAPHFVEQIRAEIIRDHGEEALYSQGLVIHTTLDIADQRAAEAAVARHLDDPEDPQAAVVGIDRSGAVRAWVGGRDFDALKLDLVSSSAGTGRQPGSTFKPIVLAANMARGHGAGVRFVAPSEITLDVDGPEPWEVDNASGYGYGVLSLREATVESVNTVYAQAILQVGPAAVVDMARVLGIDSELEPQPSLALGTEEVYPIELATVFSTLSRDGRRIDPFRITKIEARNGRVLFEREPTEGEQVVEPEVANTVTDVLSDVPRWGTATRAALDDRPMAAKTGTTQRNADAWLAGYTPEYTAVVWVGNAETNEPMGLVDGVRVYGGSIPAMIWHDFMAEALSDVPPTPFPEPDWSLLRDTGRVEFVVGDGPSLPTTTQPPPPSTTSSTSSTSSTSTSSTSTTSTTEPDESTSSTSSSSSTTTTTASDGSADTSTESSTSDSTTSSSTTTTTAP